MLVLTWRFWRRIGLFFSRDPRVPADLSVRPQLWWIRAVRCLFRSAHRRTPIVVYRDRWRIMAGRCRDCGAIHPRTIDRTC